MKIIILGGQGSGKSTQAKSIAQKLNLPCVEMGQILRDRSSANDQYSEKIQSALALGDLVEDNITMKLLHDRLKQPDCRKGYVLDGYPRNFAQIEGVDKDIDIVFFIRISDHEAVKRLIGRGRSDDNFDVLRRRLELFHHKTEPLLEYFKENGSLEEIDGERSVETIEKDIARRIENVRN